MVTVALPGAIPSVEGLPVLGNLLQFRRDLPHFLLRVSREHGDVCWIKVGSRRVLFLNAPEYIQPVLVDHTDSVDKRAGGGSAKTLIMGDGLLNSEGAFHQRQRKLCAPAFQPRRISTYDQTMVEYAERVASSWPDGAVIDLSEQMNTLTMGVAGKALFGADLLDEADELREALLIARHHISRQIQGLLRVPLSWPTPRNRRFLGAVGRLNATIYRLIDERRKGGEGGEGEEERRDLLSLLLLAQDEGDGTGKAAMSAKQVRDEAINLFWAGHETTAIALTWALYLLARNPEIGAQMHIELEQVLAGRPPTAADMPRLPYTQQVFKEALRIYPPIFAFGRQTQQALQLGGYDVPAGADLLISPYTLHRRPEYFPDPERFDPGRFTSEAERQRPRLAYLPFGGGRHICIGAHFAMMEAVLTLATIAQRVTFELVPEQHIVPEAIMTQQTGDRVLVSVKRRA